MLKRRLAILFILITFAGVMLAGCGGPEVANQEELAQIRKSRLERKKKEDAQRKKAEAEAEKKRLLSKENVRNAPKSLRDRNKIRLPSDITMWSREQYFDAKYTRSAKLVEAIEFLGGTLPQLVEASQANDKHEEKDAHSPAKDREKIEKILIDLLCIDPESNEDLPRPYRSDEIKALIRVIADNPNARFRKVLHDIATGKVATDNDAIALETLVGIVQERPDPDYENLLYEIITTDRHDDQSTKINTIQRKIDRLIRGLLASQRFSSAMRLRLAEYVGNSTEEVAYQKEILSCLSQAMPDNVPAQRFMLEEGNSGAISEDEIVGYFVAFSSACMVRTLDIPEILDPKKSKGTRYRSTPVLRAMRRASLAANSNQDTLLNTISGLRDDALAVWLRRRLFCLSSLEAQGQYVALAATFPSEQMRKASRNALVQNWTDGPKGLRKVGLPNKLVTDPAFLAVLKSAAAFHNPGDNPRKSKRRRASHSRTSYSKKKNNRRTGVMVPELDDWGKMTHDTVLTSCHRFMEAAANREATMGVDSKMDRTSDFPIAVHQDARVVHRYTETWPRSESGEEDLGPLAPMRLNYLRCHEMIIAEDIIEHYHDLDLMMKVANKEEVWFTRLEENQEAKTCRSVDVVIRRMNTDRPYSPTEPQKLSIDLLVIEIPAVKTEQPDPEGRTASR